MPAQYTVGELLPNGATVTADIYTTFPDGSAIETMTATYPNGAQDHEVIQTYAPGSPPLNKQTIQSRVQTNLGLLETWVTNNPNGAILTAAQTKVLAQMLIGLCRLLLQEFNTVGGS